MLGRKISYNLFIPHDFLETISSKESLQWNMVKRGKVYFFLISTNCKQIELLNSKHFDIFIWTSTVSDLFSLVCYWGKVDTELTHWPPSQQLITWSWCWFTCSADFLLLTRERRMRVVVTVLVLFTWQQVVPVSGNCLKLPSLESNSL